VETETYGSKDTSDMMFMPSLTKNTVGVRAGMDMVAKREIPVPLRNWSP